MEAKRKKELLNRLRSIEGHVRGIERMLEQDAYCIDILKQSQAVQKALDKVDGLILENHLNNCLIEAIRSDQPQERERVIGELLDVFETSDKLQGR